jgi:hypothetical protein
MWFRVSPLMALIFVIIASCVTPRSACAQNTLSIQEWIATANLIEKSKANVYETRLFDTADGELGIVVLATRASAWNLYVFTRGDDKRVHLDWESGPLSDTFSITDRSNLKIISADAHLRNLVQFKACNLKASPLVCSIVLYDPVKVDSFTVTRDATNKISCSANLQLRENKVYRDWLDREIMSASGLSIISGRQATKTLVPD